MKIGDLLHSAARALREAGRDDPQRDACHLLASALKKDLAWVLAHPEEEVDPPLQRQYDSWIRERAAGRPVAYLTGHREFYGRDFLIDDSVLVPRPETETVVEGCLEALESMRPGREERAGMSAADIGTGSGCIAVTLAAESADLEVLATDASPLALNLAAANARRHGVAHRVEFHLADLLPPATRRFNLMVSNPPYVAEDDPQLAPEVRRHEPAMALFAGPDGLDFYRRLIPLAEISLVPGGWLVLELGYRTEGAVRGLLDSANWGEVRVMPDLAGIPRCLMAQRR